MEQMCGKGNKGWARNNGKMDKNGNLDLTLHYHRRSWDKEKNLFVWNGNKHKAEYKVYLGWGTLKFQLHLHSYLNKFSQDLQYQTAIKYYYPE